MVFQLLTFSSIKKWFNLHENGLIKFNLHKNYQNQ